MLLEYAKMIPNDIDIIYINEKNEPVMVLFFDEELQDFYPMSPKDFFEYVGWDEDEIGNMSSPAPWDKVFHNGWRAVTVEH